MSQATYYIGDVFDVMATLPDASVDLVLTSPPFLALRSYLPADHPDKAKEIGSEPTPAAFLDTLLALTAEWRRLLAPHGSIAVELGDTYSGSGGAGGDYNDGGMRAQQPKFRQGTPRWDGRPDGQVRTTTSDPVAYPPRSRTGWPLAKSLALIPEMYRIALAYGINPLTGQPSPAGRWRVRNVVRWVRPNPPVGALGDKFRPATTDLVVACVSKDRWFDLDAVREPHMHPKATHTVGNVSPTRGDHGDPAKRIENNPAGAPPLDWWNIPPGGFSGAHYAVWPSELLIRPIKAMCPAEVCRVCGEPRRRIVGDVTYTNDDGTERTELDEQWRHGRVGLKGDHLGKAGHLTRVAPTVGWSDCGHGDYRPGVVLDPFGGSGTTGLVATGHGRDAWLIDIDERNADLARDRIGMFLDVVDTRERAA